MAGPLQQQCSFTCNNVAGYKSWATFISNGMATLGFVNCGASFTVDSAVNSTSPPIPTTTYTTTAPHTMLVGEWVWVTGMANPSYNLSSVKITAVTSNTFTVSTLVQVGTASSAQGGSATTAPGCVNWANVTTLNHLPTRTMRQGNNLQRFRGPWAGGIAYAGGLESGSPGGMADAVAPTANHSAGLDIVTYNGITYEAMNITRYPVTWSGSFVVKNTATSFSIGAPGFAFANPNLTINGTFPAGGSNAYLNYAFTISGANAPGNNGTFICTSSSTTQIVVTNAGGVTDTTTTGTISSSAINTSYTAQTNYFSGGTGQIPGANPWAGQVFAMTGFHTDANNTLTVLNVTGVSSSGSSMTLTGSWVTGGSSAFVGLSITVSGFEGVSVNNNGTYICIASSAGSITLTNPNSPTSTFTGYNVIATFPTFAFAVTGVSSTGSAMTLTGGWSTGGSGAFVGQYFSVSGFTAPDTNNNGGPYLCTASSAGSITLTNPNSPTNGHAGNGVASFAFVIVASTSSTVAVTNVNGVTETATNTGVTFTPYIYRASPPSVDLWQGNANLGTNQTLGIPTGVVILNVNTLTLYDGPVNTANTWQPMHYEVWRTNDGLKPIYIRWGYYVDSTTGRPNLSWAISYVMRDSIIMNSLYPFNYEALMNSTSGTVSDYGATYECDMAGSGTAGWLTLCLWRTSVVTVSTTNGISLIFALERANDHQGNHLDTYFTVLTCARSDSALRQMTQFKPGAGSRPPALGLWSVAQLPLSQYGVYGSPISPVWPLAGFLGNPLTAAVSVVGIAASGDVMEGTIFPAVLYGQTHYYLSCNNAGATVGVGSAAGNTPAIRFEAA